MDEATLKAARILIIDDEEEEIGLVVGFLNMLGYRNLRTLTDPARAVEQLGEFDPDIVLLDLTMPGVNGFQVLEQIRRHEPCTATLPVLVLTGEALPKIKRNALAVGATDLLQKPFDAVELLMRMRNLLRSRLLQRQLHAHNLHLEQLVADRTHELQTSLDELNRSHGEIDRHERLRMLGELVSGVFHDFNNALVSVVGYSDLLTQEPALLDNRTAALGYLQAINDAGHEAAKVINQLRPLCCPRATTDAFAILDLNQLILDVIELTKPKWKDQQLARGKTISFQLQLEEIPLILGDAAELQEAAANLVFNAVDALPEGGVIRISTFQEGAKVHWQITDPGTGMTEEARDRCLEPFYTTKGEAHSGLGMSIVSRTVRRHGGELRIESRPNEGSTISVSLPAEHRTDSPSIWEDAPASRSLRALVVDDEAAVREIVSLYLSEDGHHVVTAASGQEALALFQSGCFDVLVTDQSMPELTGIQLAAAIKRIDPRFPVILFTGFDEGDLSSAAESASVDAIIGKPLLRNVLRRTLSRLLPEKEPA